MGIDFIRKAAPSFRKGLDRRRIELATPNLFTQEPTSAPRAYAAQLRGDKPLAVGERLGVRLDGQNVLATRGLDLVAVFKSPTAELKSALSALHDGRECWVNPGDRRIGFVRAIRSRQDDEDPLLTGFLMDAQRAAREVAGLPGTTPGQLVAAMQELENNIHEHSDAPDTGLLAFRATRGAFEFVAADRGIGILRSLQRCSTFAALQDHGIAIQAALSDGTSRFGSDSRRGHGFRPIFLGLANLQGSLRFRSGDHALLIDGTSPHLATAQLAQKPLIEGFLASVRCEVSVRSN